ncbi:uncharacterized protein LOC111088009 [Limulus polyphemus]|uniref:Uncharacterized protein LOC111088009 n=1 Tax=Limulus polyphemus TaxID=6850 RepID=A0ABM1T971_LIMPO|nr:uncharacterized protein LOC111088009 [Limulus polyphemus]
MKVVLVNLCFLFLRGHIALGLEDPYNRFNQAEDSVYGGPRTYSDYVRYPYDKYIYRDAPDYRYGTHYDSSSNGKYSYGNRYNDLYGKRPVNSYNSRYQQTTSKYSLDNRPDYQDRYNPSYHSSNEPEGRYYGNRYTYYRDEPKYSFDRNHNPSYSPYRYNDNELSKQKDYRHDSRYGDRNYPDDHRIYYNLQTGEYRVSGDKEHSNSYRPYGGINNSYPGYYQSSYGLLKDYLGYEWASPSGYLGYGPGYRRSYSKEETSKDAVKEEE